MNEFTETLAQLWLIGKMLGWVFGILIFVVGIVLSVMVSKQEIVTSQRQREFRQNGYKRERNDE